jgi:hypothetical protein
MAVRRAVIRGPDDTREEVTLDASTMKAAMETLLAINDADVQKIVLVTRRIGSITLLEAISKYFGNGTGNGTWPEVLRESLSRIGENPVADYLNRWMEIFKRNDCGSDDETGISIKFM